MMLLSDQNSRFIFANIVIFSIGSHEPTSDTGKKV